MSKETTATRRTGAAGTIDVSPPAAEATDIHVLIIDDSEDDALVTIRELKRGGYSPTFERVDTAEAMMSALKNGPWDVIICDYIMPSFSGLAALNVFKASGLDLPFILVSGKVGEERAVEAMRAGATDYVMKDKLNRLVPAIKRELNEVKSRIEYRKAAQSLKQSEERYQALAENYSDVIWVTDMNRQTTYISPSVTRLLGHSVEELMAHGLDLTPASLKASMNATAQALSAKQEGKARKVLRIPPLELEMKHKDGSIVWASTSLSFIPDSDGRPVEIVAVLHDTTARKKAADILRASEERLKILFESAPDAYYLCDMEAKLIDGNRTAEKLTGYKREELIGESLVELGLIAAEEIPKAAAMLDRNLHGQSTGPDEFVLKRKDGSLVNVEINTFPTTINGQRLVLGSMRDLTERRKAEESTRESEARFKALFEYAPDGLYLNDLQGNILDANKAAFELFGYTREEVLGKSFLELGLLSTDQIEKGVAALQSAMTKLDSPEQLSSHEFVLNRRDGRKATVEIKTIPVKVNGEDVMIGIVRDITESKRMEEALLLQEKHFRALIERSSDVVVVLNKDGTTRYVSPSVEAMFGVTPKQTIGGGLTASLHPDDMQAVAEDWVQIVEHPDVPTHGVRRVRHSDGSWRYVEAVSHNLLDDPAVQGIVINLRDITERKRAEETLKESEVRYRLLAENLSDVIWTMDANLRYTYMSPSVTSLLGFSVEEAMARKMEDCLTPASLETALQVMAEAEAKQGTGPESQPSSVTLELEMPCKDGSTVWAENRITYLRDSEGRLTGYQGVSRDITERKKTQEELQKLASIVKRSSELVNLASVDGKMIFLNDAGCVMLGIDPKEVQQTDIMQVIPDHLREKVETELWPALMREGGTWEGELQYRNLKTGQLTDVHAMTFRITDPVTGALLCVANVSLDITERKKTEEAVKESEKRYRLLAENVSDVIWVTDMNLQPVYTSPSIARLLGYSAEESMARKMEDSLTPASLKQAAETFTKILSLKEAAAQNAFGTRPLELEFIRKDGSTIWTSTTVSVMRDPDGRPTAIMGVLHNITERKKAEEAQRESEKRYRLLAENASDVISVTDMNMRPIYMSPSVTRLLGYSVEEAMAHGIESGLTPESIKVATEGFAEALTAEQKGEERKPVTIDLEFIRKDGSTVWVATSVSFIRGSDGQPAEILSILHDITERKKTEEVLRESEERLKILFEYAPDVYCLSTPEGTVLDANKAAFELLGYRKEEVIGKTFIESGVISPEQFEGGTAATAYGPNEPVEMVLNRKDGTKVTVEIKTFPVKIKGQTLLLSIARDTTERQEVKSRLEQTLKKLERTMEGTIQSISRMVETRDPYTAGHQWRMTQLACAIAREEGLDSEFVEVVRIVGLLHDLGKIGIPSEILSKPGLLTDIEFGMIKAHSQIGYEILKTVDFPWPIAGIVLQHHERLNGSGYPLGLHEEDICPEAKILAVADVVEAMSSHRPYRPSLGIDKALEEITRNSGTLYDPDAVNACLRLFAEKRFTFDDRK